MKSAGDWVKRNCGEEVCRGSVARRITGRKGVLQFVVLQNSSQVSLLKDNSRTTGGQL